MVLPVILSWVFSIVHPLHVSVTDMVYDEKERELEIIIRIFTDDLETAIRTQRNNPDLDLLAPANSTTDELVKDYVLQRFSVSLDGKKQVLKFLGTQVEDDALLCYIQVHPVKKWKTMEVLNSIITEIYDDQSNLVHVTVGERVRSLRLIKNSPLGTLTF